MVEPSDLHSWVLQNDERLLVVDKPGWLVVHPSKRGPWSSLAGAVREEFKLDKVRLIYRLDRETSGVVVLAKDEDTGSRLQKAILKGRLRKLYVAILEGTLPGGQPVEVHRHLGPDLSANVSVKQKVVEPGTPGAQSAATWFEPLFSGGGYTLVGVELITGRKHQIRAHAEYLGCRVVGDKLYGPDPGLYLEFATNGWTPRHSQLLALTRQALHCAAIDLRPAGLPDILRAPWPHDLAGFGERRMGLPAAEAQRLIDDFAARRLPTVGH